MLAVGLLTEALYFALSAFEPVDNELDWSLVYPELATGVKVQRDQRRNLYQIRKECYLKN
jgi:gliding motility-associated protein GldL